ncbi:hypothetical protein IM538_21510 [Cytobacillus suaedae]|nr:hypothetical protein IM538_21510 [Cytobacillus suaedae]
MPKKLIAFFSFVMFLFVFTVPNSSVDAASVSNAEKLVKQAEAYGVQLKKEISVEYTKQVEIPDQKLYNATKVALDKARVEVNKLSASHKQAFEKRLKDNVEIHYLRAQAYIDAMVSGGKIVSRTDNFNKLFSLNPLSDETELAYHALTSEIRKQHYYIVFMENLREKQY